MVGKLRQANTGARGRGGGQRSRRAAEPKEAEHCPSEEPRFKWPPDSDAAAPPPPPPPSQYPQVSPHPGPPPDYVAPSVLQSLPTGERAQAEFRLVEYHRQAVMHHYDMMRCHYESGVSHHRFATTGMVPRPDPPPFPDLFGYEYPCEYGGEQDVGEMPQRRREEEPDDEQQEWLNQQLEESEERARREAPPAEPGQAQEQLEEDGAPVPVLYQEGQEPTEQELEQFLDQVEAMEAWQAPIDTISGEPGAAGAPAAPDRASSAGTAEQKSAGPSPARESRAASGASPARESSAASEQKSAGPSPARESRTSAASPAKGQSPKARTQAAD
eukprot:TRINITY_DN710_c0_g1_i1.p1 TRINITY_DN710_c0_g1~~TRINITY_DN710_c0_g1_i1.p1  ORF type:complete len:329 (+),score=110.25 TRINITY_DN710_c0_g1_i1:95-1081(+)